MRFALSPSMLLCLLAASAPSVAAEVPPHHPSVDVLHKFSQHFRCPYANDWVSKGPKQAALDLGLWNATQRQPAERNVRRRAQENAAGSCTYTNSWTNQPSCLEFRGDSWTEASMGERCTSETDSTLTMGAPCEVSSEVRGYCVVGEGGSIEATPMEGIACDMAKSTCETFMTGSFVEEATCAEGGAPPEAATGSEGGFPYAVEAPSEPASCAIAPGAIGAAHQAAYSIGYRPDCEGTPAEGSPYMWPMAWKAHVESKSMAFGSDDVVYQSKGNVHYRLDKNWKRMDWYYQRGVQRSIGQAPCDPENIVEDLNEGPVLACRRDSDEYNTMIHRGSKMFFISWKNDTEVGSSDPSQIDECNWLDLQVIGNVRNDWYMDDRGDSTDVQYLGDQHVFYAGEPRLVKQWRKKDFANQYFVMSVQANVKQDGIHWPMILNVPGEGFGDDFLQVYENQTLLTDDDDYLFLLDEALEGIGRTCNQMDMGGSAGPPVGQTVHIPSNLEVDPNSWRSIVVTYSPVWEPPVEEEQSMVTGSTGMATTQEGDVTVKSCYDTTAKAVKLEIEFSNIEIIGAEMPWLALGYRETEECLMNPRGGGDSEIILVADNEAHHTLLPTMARSFDDSAVSSIYENMTPLGDKEGYSDVVLHTPSTASSITKSVVEGDEEIVMLHFKQSMPSAPAVMHLMYAIGSTPEVSYHKTRKCFDIVEFPACPAGESSIESSESETNSATSVSSAGRTAVAGTILGALLVMAL